MYKILEHLVDENESLFNFRFSNEFCKNVISQFEQRVNRTRIESFCTQLVGMYNREPMFLIVTANFI